MDLEKASQVYDILVTHAGASENLRTEFIHYMMTNRDGLYPLEFRFGGLFGLGGKFWYPHYKVTCYPEDTTVGRKVLLDEVNRILEEVK